MQKTLKGHFITLKINIKSEFNNEKHNEKVGDKTTSNVKLCVKLFRCFLNYKNYKLTTRYMRILSRCYQQIKDEESDIQILNNYSEHCFKQCGGKLLDNDITFNQHTATRMWVVRVLAFSEIW